jgi:hypothetical protein
MLSVKDCRFPDFSNMTLYQLVAGLQHARTAHRSVFLYCTYILIECVQPLRDVTLYNWYPVSRITTLSRDVTTSARGKQCVDQIRVGAWSLYRPMMQK